MEIPTKQKRVRRSRDEINGLLECFEQSGQTQKDFCRDRNLSIATLSSWRRKYGSGESPACLRPVRMTADVLVAGPTVRTPGGVEVFLPSGTAVAEIAALVEVLERSRSC